MKTSQEQKIFLINGDNFSDLDGFLLETEKVLCNEGFRSGRNLNAFIDLLRGGFGKFEYEEHIQLIWKNSASSMKNLGEELFNDIVGYIKEQPHVTLRLE